MEALTSSTSAVSVETRRGAMTRPTIKPSDFRAEAQRLNRDGKMPTLKQVIDTIDEVKRTPAHVPMRDFDDDAETMLIRNRKGGSQ